MIRTEFVRNVVRQYYMQHEPSAINITTVDNLLEVMSDVFAKGLKEDGKVTLKNIIIAQVVQKPERKGYDPYHDKLIKYKPKSKIRVKMGKRIKNIISS